MERLGYHQGKCKLVKLVGEVVMGMVTDLITPMLMRTIP